MKKYIANFVQRGLVGAAFGPIVLAVIYACLGASDVVESLPVNEVVIAILSITVMAFIAAGITSVYHVERLPLACAILIHALALYLDYVIVYLINGWIADGAIPFLVFTAIFFAGFALVWLLIYLCIRSKAKKISKALPK